MVEAGREVGLIFKVRIKANVGMKVMMKLKQTESLHQDILIHEKTVGPELRILKALIRKLVNLRS